MTAPADTARLIEARLQQALAPIRVQVEDESAAHRGHPGAAGGGGHFRLLVVSDAFEGKAPLARHRMVYALLKDALRGDIHALAITARTPAEDALQAGAGPSPSRT